MTENSQYRLGLTTRRDSISSFGDSLNILEDSEWLCDPSEKIEPCQHYCKLRRAHTALNHPIANEYSVQIAAESTLLINLTMVFRRDGGPCLRNILQ